MESCVCCAGAGVLLPSVVCPLCDGVPGWPEVQSQAPSAIEMNCRPAQRLGPARGIRAIHDTETIRVYQAYSDAIADMAVAANSFRAPKEAGIWSSSRMTWIKPSAVWMAYRCGWTVMKDMNQRRVLALDLSRPRFEQLLMGAVLSHGLPAGSTKALPVVVQWDPERFMSGSKEERQALTTSAECDIRSIQIGLRGVEDLLDPAFVLKITDVTASFRQAHAALSSSPPDFRGACAALWPDRQEEYVDVPPELFAVLRMSADSDEEGEKRQGKDEKGRERPRKEMQDIPITGKDENRKAKRNARQAREA